MEFKAAKENTFTLQEVYMKEKSLIIKDMEMVFINIRMEIFMMDNG